MKILTQEERLYLKDGIKKRISEIKTNLEKYRHWKANVKEWNFQKGAYFKLLRLLR